MRSQPDPRRTENCIDAHVLDVKGTPEDAVVDEILELNRDRKISIMLPHTVQEEINHPNTPLETRRRAADLLYTMDVQLSAEELALRDKVRIVFQGNANPGKHKSDAYHVFEAMKYGNYFITNDVRILKKGKELSALLYPAQIVTPTQFLSIYRQSETDAP
jgi:hypothetical protein